YRSSGVRPCCSTAARMGHPSSPTRRSSDLRQAASVYRCIGRPALAEDASFSNLLANPEYNDLVGALIGEWTGQRTALEIFDESRSEEHTSELQSRENIVCRPLLEKKKTRKA